MEITKIDFNESKYGVTFEQLDLNNDNVISGADLDLTKNSKIKNVITNVLNEVDPESNLLASTPSKTSAANKTGSMETLTGNNLSDKLNDSKGVVFVVFGKQGCGRCTNAKNIANNNMGELSKYGDFYYSDIQTAYNLVPSKYRQGGMYPFIVKFVDGKPVEQIEYSSNEKTLVSNFVNSAKKAGATGDKDTTTETTSGKTATAKTDADVAAAAKNLLAKYPVNGTASSSYDMNNPALVAFKKAIEGGAISELGKEGFSAEQIIDIISSAYPNIGIKKNNKGGYDCPNGTDSDAKALYNKFIEQISNVTTDTVKALQEQVKKLNVDITNNNMQLKALSAEITSIQKDIEYAISKAIEESEEIEEEQKKDSEKTVKEELAKYAESNGEMSYETFQNNLTARLNSVQSDGTSKLSNAILKLMNAESKMNVLKNYLSKFSTLIEANKTLTTKVADLSKQASSAADCPGCSPTRCDPIGFSANDVQYDFFVDKDKNGKLSNENEFLGASDGWSEMVALDTNKDGKVTSDEMKDLKVMTTDADCNQKVVNASDVFGANDFIDLNSYKNVNKDFDNGNTLLGSFSLSLNGENLTDGYNTLDKLSWLDAHYSFSDKEEGINRFAQGNTKAEDILNYSTKYTEFNSNYEKYDKNLTQAWTKVGITRSNIETQIIEAAKANSDKDAEEIENNFKKHANCVANEE